jgi:hypothetical protein
VAPDANAIEVDVGILRGEVLDTGDLVGDGVVAEVAVVELVEALGAPGRAHAVNADDEEAEFGEGLIVALRGAEAAAAAGAGLGAGVNVVDDGIFLGGVEVDGLP